MRISQLQKFSFLLFLIALLCNAEVNAQSYDDDDRPVLQEEFCLRLKKIIGDKLNNYANLADSVDTEQHLQASAEGFFPVKKEVTFAQARKSGLVGDGPATKYRTVFMVRDSKDALLPSYKNIFSIIKDCLYFDYEFKETELLGIKEIKSLGYKSYENIGTPLNIKDFPQSEICFMIQKNKLSGQFELVLEIR